MRTTLWEVALLGLVVGTIWACDAEEPVNVQCFEACEEGRLACADEADVQGASDVPCTSGLLTCRDYCKD